MEFSTPTETEIEATIALCKQTLPLDILTKISSAYRKRVAPRPKFIGYTELRTIEPKVASKHFNATAKYKAWTEITHSYPFNYNGGIYEITVYVGITGKPEVFYVNEIIAGQNLRLRIATLNVWTYQSRGKLHLAISNDDASRRMMLEVIGAMCIVCSRYNYDLLNCRLSWVHAVRKQKCVRHLWNGV